MKHLSHALSLALSLALFVGAAAGPVQAAEALAPTAAERGAKLYSSYGCGNCHGQDGMTPVSKYVPSLRGKPASHLVKNAAAILQGDRSDGHARLMHAQYCIPGDETANCPKQADLQLIAEWLASDKLPDRKQTPLGLYLSAPEAYEFMRVQGDKALFLDIRTREEVAFLGMPMLADANIPYMVTGGLDEWDEKDGNFKLRANPDFATRVERALKRKGLTTESPVILICRSGDRSAKAASILFLSGYKKVYSVVDGYEGDKVAAGDLKGQRVVNGWKNEGLPWSYKLDKSKMYWELE